MGNGDTEAMAKSVTKRRSTSSEARRWRRAPRRRVESRIRRLRDRDDGLLHGHVAGDRRSKEERAAISDYFKNPSMDPGKSTKPAPGQMGPGGASTSPIDLGGGMDAPKTFRRNRLDGG